MKNTKFLSLGTKDFIKGLILTTITSVLSGILVCLQAGGFPDKAGWTVIGTTALTTILGYLIKNLGTNSEGNFLSKEPKKNGTI